MLVIGDFHVPDRAAEIPLSIVNSVNMACRERRFDAVCCTGDLTSVNLIVPTLNLWSDNVLIVQGNMDYDMRNAIGFPRRVTLDTSRFLHGDSPLVICMTHGHQVHPRGDLASLESIALENKSRIMISGHTHAPSVHLYPNEGGAEKKVLLLNPGSATGAWSFLATGTLSYMLLDIEIRNAAYHVSIDAREISNTQESRRIEEYDLPWGT
nr:YfcE family phosphodiesterase [Candidatus Sigynarchaeota archaeon]